MNSKAIAYLKFILSLLIFGTNGTIAHSIHLSSYEIIFFRTLIGGSVLLLLLFSLKVPFHFKENKKDLYYITLSGASMGISWTFLFEAYDKLGVSIAALFYACGPVIIMLLSPFLFKEKITKEKLVGFSAVFLGILMVNGASSFEGLSNPKGILAGALSAIFYATMVIFNKKAKNISGIQNTSLLLVVSFIIISLFILVRQGAHISVMPSDWFPILVLGLVNTALACYLYFSPMGQLPVQSVAVLGYLEPLTAIVFSVIFLGEIMTPMQIIGGTLILSGAMICEGIVRYPSLLKKAVR